MNNVLKKSFIVVVMFYSIIISFYSFKTYSRNVETVVKIGKDTISRSDIEKRIIKDYWQNTQSVMIDELLYSKEAEKLNFLNPSRSEMNNEAEIIKKTDRNPLNLSNKKDFNYVKDRIIVKKLAKKYTINDEKLEQFLRETEDFTGDHTYNVSVFEGEYELVNKITKDIENKVSIKAIETKYGIKFINKKLHDENEYDLNLHDFKIGEVNHAHGKKSHLVLILNSVIEEPFNIKDNREDVIETYLSKKFFHEKIEVTNYLYTKFTIEILNENQ
jgi:hypothetical protein